MGRIRLYVLNLLEIGAQIFMVVLLERADKDLQDAHGITAVTFPAFNGHAWILHLLLQASADHSWHDTSRVRRFQRPRKDCVLAFAS